VGTTPKGRNAVSQEEAYPIGEGKVSKAAVFWQRVGRQRVAYSSRTLSTPVGTSSQEVATVVTKAGVIDFRL
jgi:hypothetical protein